MEDKGQEIRRRRRGERGQSLVIFIMIFITLCLFAIVAVSIGQILVRRQQAQMIVDAAAFSGAAKQAEGMNTIARFNEKELHLLQAIYATKFIPYVDSYSTTASRDFAGAITLLWNDWAGDAIEHYGDLFKIMNAVVKGVNIAYSPFALPSQTANSIINENFGDDDDRLFKSADLQDSGVLIEPSRLGDVTKLVNLTDPETYKVNGQYTYVFWPTYWSIFTCELIPPADAPCAWTLAQYGGVNAAINAYRLFNPFEYEAGQFYDNDEGEDVRFAYFLTVSQAPVLFGKNFFDDIPSVTVAAAAKPYGGYLGDEFDGGYFLPHGQQSGKEISYTYKAKLVPLSNEEVIALAIRSGDPGDMRWLPSNVLH
jgi:hypothetical protein